MTTKAEFQVRLRITVPADPENWSVCAGIGGQFPPEWLVNLERNEWSGSSGIGGQFAPEYAPSGVGGVLPAIPGEERLRGSGQMDTAAVALHPVAAVEEAAHQSREDDPTGDREGESLVLVQQWAGTLVECRSVAYERCDHRQVAQPAGTYEPSGRASTSCVSCMNRRMPNGTYGGVGGGGP